MPGPGLDQHLSFAQAVEHLAPQQLVAELAVEGLDVAALPWRAPGDVGCLGPDCLDPALERLGHELGVRKLSMAGGSQRLAARRPARQSRRTGVTDGLRPTQACRPRGLAPRDHLTRGRPRHNCVPWPEMLAIGRHARDIRHLFHDGDPSQNDRQEDEGRGGEHRDMAPPRAEDGSDRGAKA